VMEGCKGCISYRVPMSSSIVKHSPAEISLQHSLKSDSCKC
jgi:hypothetical protein